MSHTYPMIWWGSAADLSTWTQAGTCTVTGSQTDPFYGTTAYQLADGAAGTRGARYKEYTAAYTGWHVAMVCMKQVGTDPTTAIKIENVTLADSSTATLAWSGGVPTASWLGSGGHYTPVSIGTDWYAQRVYVAAIAGNTMRLHLYPSSSTVAEMTAGYFYVRNGVLLDLFDTAMTWEEPREGSSWAQGGSGVEDAWIQGTDYRFAGTLIGVPQLDRDSPAPVSGWNSPNETTGVNCGVDALLRAGRNKETLTLFADRTVMSGGSYGAALYGVDSYLADPMRGEPEMRPNGDRSFRLELRNASKPYTTFDLA